jgi:hypothetical protein
MTPDTEARAGYRRPRIGRADSGATIRPGELAAEAAPTSPWGVVAHPPVAQVGDLPHAGPARSSRPRAGQRAARRAQGDASVVKVVPLLAVIIVTVAGVYIAWEKGSAGGGEGGVIGGVALLIAAVARLLLPARLVGLLAARKRGIDVITLTAFGASLLVAGLVLPR